MSKKVYVHIDSEHDMDDPNEIVPLLYEIFSPDSVVDLGCGIGNFLYKFKECGTKKVLGIDGQWCKNELQMLSDEEILVKNLYEEISLEDKFDMAICLEVAEHLDEKYSNKIINDLVNLSDVIIFSAAIPGQGGQNHINEQWPNFWVTLFREKGFLCFDAIRPVIWNNSKVKFWYKQNLFIAINSKNTKQIEDIVSNFPFVNNKENIVLSLVHPELYIREMKRIDRVMRMLKGKGRMKEYKDMILNRFIQKYK